MLPESLKNEFMDLWHEFENGETFESRIARGVDRINPAIMRLVTGQGWADVSGNVEHLDKIQLPRVQFSQTLMEIYSSVKEDALAKGFLLP